MDVRNNRRKDAKRESFEQIQAESELKESTKAFLWKKTKGYRKRYLPNTRFLIPACACMLLAVFWGYHIYFTPTVEISIDMNPSLEMGANRFDRVISVKSLNEDGAELTDTLNLKYRKLEEALEEILEDEQVSALLSKDEVMAIGVIGADEQSEQGSGSGHEESGYEETGHEKAEHGGSGRKGNGGKKKNDIQESGYSVKSLIK